MLKSEQGEVTRIPNHPKSYTCEAQKLTVSKACPRNLHCETVLENKTHPSAESITATLLRRPEFDPHLKSAKTCSKLLGLASLECERINLVQQSPDLQHLHFKFFHHVDSLSKSRNTITGCGSLTASFPQATKETTHKNCQTICGRSDGSARNAIHSQGGMRIQARRHLIRHQC